jgi:hypothetical protein
MARITLPVLLAAVFAGWAVAGVTPSAAQTPMATPTARQTAHPAAAAPRQAMPVTVLHGPAPDLSAPLPGPQAVPPSSSPLPTEVSAPPTLTATSVLPTATLLPPTPSPSPTSTDSPPTPTITPVPPTPTLAVSLLIAPTTVPVGVPLPEAAANAIEPDPEDEMAQAALAAAGMAAPAILPLAEPAPTIPLPAATVAPARPAAAVQPPSNALRVTPRPPPALAYHRALPSTPGWVDESLLWLGVPSRTQYDGTAYQATNCGPSALGMILEAYGLRLPTAELRDYANALQGSDDPDDGIALDHLTAIGRRVNLRPMGLYQDGGGYRHWSIEDVRAAIRQGYPVIALVVYGLLPGNGGYDGSINHYIVLDGLLGEDFLYNDSAVGERGGQGLLISAQQLETAWASADISHHAVAFGIGDQRDSLLNPERIVFAGGIGNRDLLASPVSAHPSGDGERLRASSDVVGRFNSTLLEEGLPPPDPADAERQPLPDEDQTNTPLLERPLVGGTIEDSFVPTASARPPATHLTADDVDTEIAAPPIVGTATPVDLRILLLLGGVASLLLLVQLGLTYFARPGRTPDARPARE